MKWQAEIAVGYGDISTFTLTTIADTFADAYEDIQKQIADNEELANGNLIALNSVYKFWYEMPRHR